MAIKVNGTTVIDDSRNLVNIVSGAGASTTAGAVGTYAFLTYNDQTAMYPGATKAGSSLKYNNAVGTWGYASGFTSPSGTWRIMGYGMPYDNNYSTSVFVRIS